MGADEDSPEREDAEASAVSPPPLRELTIDKGLLLIAFDEGFGGETESYLDLKTGEILTVSENLEEDEEISARIEAEPDRYEPIERLDSHSSFRIMDNFAGSLPASPVKQRLFEALARNKPFRRFKDIVHADLALRQELFAFQEQALEGYARDWLEVNGIAAKWMLPGDFADGTPQVSSN